MIFAGWNLEKAISWQIEGFSSEGYEKKLRELHDETLGQDMQKSVRTAS